jgi:hypothetical protein
LAIGGAAAWFASRPSQYTQHVVTGDVDRYLDENPDVARRARDEARTFVPQLRDVTLDRHAQHVFTILDDHRDGRLTMEDGPHMRTFLEEMDGDGDEAVTAAEVTATIRRAVAAHPQGLALSASHGGERYLLTEYGGEHLLERFSAHVSPAFDRAYREHVGTGTWSEFEWRARAAREE